MMITAFLLFLTACGLFVMAAVVWNSFSDGGFLSAVFGYTFFVRPILEVAVLVLAEAVNSLNRE